MTATIATRSIHDRLVRRLRITALLAVPLTLSVSPGVAQLPGVKPRIFRPEAQQGGHMKLLAVALLGLTLAACGSPPTWTLWQVNTSGGTVTDIKELEKGLERTACELVKQGHVKSTQAITSGSGLLVNHTADGAAFTIVSDGSTTTVSFRCLKSGEKPSS